MAKPERFGMMSALPAEFQPARRHEAHVLARLRRRGYVVEWVAVHELTKRGQRHGHYLMKGDYIPQAVWQEVHGAIVHVEAIRGARGATAYALKEALGTVRYATKGVAQLEEHLALNGGRLSRATRGYWSS